MIVVAEMQETIVGYSLLDTQTDAASIRSQFQIEDFIYFYEHSSREHLTLEHSFLLPTVESKQRSFLKETMLLMKATCVYFRSFLGEHLPNIVREMIPIQPRQR